MSEPAIAADPAEPAIAADPEPMSEPAIAEPEPTISADPEPAPSVVAVFFLQPVGPTARAKAKSIIAVRMRYPPGGMLRGFLAAFILTTSLLTPASADDLRMPPGTRHDASGQLVSGRGLRDTTDFLAKELAARGIAVAQTGPYRVRGVEVTRFVSQSPTTPWLAIHILRSSGKTLIFFVPRPPLDERPPTR
jgi:hypothetical protein